MKAPSHLSKLAILLLTGLFSASLFAAPIWVEWPASRGGNGHFYALTELAHADWRNAESEANTHAGGHLVSITSEAEQLFLNNNLLTGSDRQRQFWIGLNDMAEEGTYVWTTGEVFQFGNWTIAGGVAWEPNNGANGYYAPDEDAVLMNFHFLLQGDYFGTWNDIHFLLSGAGERGVIEVPSNPLAGALAITAHPDPQVRNVGDTATFSVSTSGAGPLTYQWRKNGFPLQGESGPSLTLTGLAHADAGDYSVQVSSPAGALISAPGRLTILTAGAELSLPGVRPVAQFWETDGRVRALLEHEGTLFAGGDFRNIGQQVPGYTLFSVTGTSSVVPLNFNGPITSIVGDGNGGYYVGGLFNNVSGTTVANLVHLLSDLTLDTSFVAQTDGYVTCMVMLEDTLYLGGEFTHVNGGTRRYLAAVNATSGSLLPWNPNPDNWVGAFSHFQGKLLVGGAFRMMGTAPRDYFAALDPVSAQPLAWGPTLNDWVSVIEPADDSVYIGGRFSQANGAPQGRAAKLAAADGSVLPFDPAPDGFINGIAVSGDTVYFSGDFSWIGGTTRYALAAFDRNSGNLLAWSPQTQNTSAPGKIVHHEGKIYVEGGFTQMSGQVRNHFAVIDASTGQLTDYSLNISGRFQTLEVIHGEVVAGGNPGLVFTSRPALAAFDMASGFGRAFTVPIDGEVHALAAYQDHLFVGGSFAAYADTARYYLISVDLRTGEISDWNPFPSTGIRALHVDGPILYVGGYFVEISGQQRDCLVAYNLETGELLPWNPNVNAYGGVTRIASRGNTLYVAGEFTHVGGQPRRTLAAIDRVSGQVTSWNPDPNLRAVSILPADDVIFVGGAFEQIGGASRHGLAALDYITGQANNWQANVNVSVLSLALREGVLFAGGQYQFINGVVQTNLAALHPQLATGNLLPWNPAVGVESSSSTVDALLANDVGLYVGGEFRTAGGEARNYLAAFPIGSALTSPRLSSSAFRTSFIGAIGQPYVFEASSNLVHWTAVSTNIAPFTFEDRQLTNHPSRFFRARPK